MIFPWCGFFFKRTLDFTTARLSDNGVSQFRWNLLHELSVYKAGPLSKNPLEMVGFSDFICIFAPSFRFCPSIHAILRTVKFLI